MAVEFKTYGDIKQMVKAIAAGQKKANVKSTGTDYIVDAVVGSLPGGAVAKTVFDFVRAATKKPDQKKSQTWIDKLDVDDDLSKIVDDSIENQFLQYIAKDIEDQPDDKPLENNFNMNAKLVDFIKNNHNGRTVTGIRENMIPKWIADIFKTRKEKRSEQEQLDLDRYVADLRMNDPEKYERLQQILKHIDPDTGHLPTGLNTAGSMDESIASDLIDAGFKTWVYTDESGRSFYPKGRNEKEAALWLRLKHKIKVDSSQIKLADRSGLGYADDTTLDIYNQRYQPDDVMQERLKKIVKELMADMPPTEKVSAMPGQDIKDQMISAISATNDPNILRQLSTVFGGAGFKDSDNLGEMKRKLVPLMSKAGAGQYLKLAQKFAVENGEIVLKSGKQDVMFTNVKENKMKVTQLKQIIREEIQKVINLQEMDLDRMNAARRREREMNPQGEFAQQQDRISRQLATVRVGYQGPGADSGQYTIDSMSNDFANALKMDLGGDMKMYSVEDLESMAAEHGVSPAFDNWLSTQPAGKQFKATFSGNTVYLKR